MCESERNNKEEMSEVLSYRASGASAHSIATRASGAELIRQLSYHKLNHYYYQSDETLNQFGGTTATKRKSATSGGGGGGASSAIVKRFSDNQYDYQYQKGQHRPAAAGAAAGATRPRLLRQSTTTNSESVTGTTATSSSSMAAVGGQQSAHNRRRQLAETREQRSWRSCDVNHHVDVAVPALGGTHRLGGSGGVRARNDSVGRSDDITTTSITPSFLDLSSSVNSMNQQSAKPSPVGSHQGQLHVNNEEDDECDDDDDDDDAFLDGSTPVRQQQQQQDHQQVRYTKGGEAAATNGQQNDEEYRVVLPPLGGTGTRSLTARKNNAATSPQNLVLLSPQLANVAGPKPMTAKKKKVVDDPVFTGSAAANKKKKKKTASQSSASPRGPKPPTSVKMAAVSAITAVAVVAVGVADKSSYPSSDESNNPRRRARGIVILTSVFLLFTCLFMVGITLRLAPLIDDLGKTLNQSN
jgi:hypothetical protein